MDAEKSNGETAFRYFVDAVKDDTLILFDEPENSLSAQWQIELSLFCGERFVNSIASL